MKIPLSILGALMLLGLVGATYRMGQNNAPQPTPAPTTPPKVIVIRPTPLPQVVIVQKAASGLSPVPEMIGGSNRREVASDPPVRVIRRTRVSASPRIAGRKKTWVDVGRWKGEGVKTTETFRIGDEQGLLMWSATPINDSTPGLMQAWLYDANGQLVDVVANQMVSSSKTDDTYFRGNGDYYLKINCANVDYDISVSDWK